MSGAEALAVLPLVISGVENYRKVAKPFKRYRRFGAEAKRFRKDFRIQQDNFCWEMELLLRYAVDSDTASAMLADADHSRWNDNSCDFALRSSLGHRCETWVMAIDLIDTELEDISKLDQKLDMILDDDPEPAGATSEAWKARVTAKIRVCLSSTSLSGKMDCLRRLNQQLHTVLDLNDRLRNANHQKFRRPHRTSISSEGQKRILSIQRTAKVLYDALEVSCNTHAEHRVNLGLNPIADLCSNHTRVRFDLAFRQPRIQTTTSDEAPVWLAIESSDPLDGEGQGGSDSLARTSSNTAGLITQRVDSSSSDARVTLVPRRHRDHPPDSMIRRVRSRLSSSQPIAQELPFIPRSGPNEACDLVDICRHHDLCTQLSDRLRAASIMNDWIGFLQNVRGPKQLVYIKKETSQSSTRHPITLADYLSTLIQPGGQLSMLILDRIRFARLLATAALHFHSTPWLKGGWWRSKDVCIVDRGQLSELGDPFIELPLKPDSDVTLPPAQCILPFRNPLLFGLALIFIGLAYERSFRSLILPLDEGGGGRSQSEIEYYAAIRLSGALGVRMIPAFKRIVERLLFCNFEADPDLSKPELQELFYSDIVCELQRLETLLEGGM